MSLNHSINLINDDYMSALLELNKKHYEPGLILVKLNPIYFNNKITEDDIKGLGGYLSELMNSRTSLYVITTVPNIAKVINGLEAVCLKINNVLTIPVIDDTQCKCTLCNKKYYDETNLRYVIFASKPCFNRVLTASKETNTCVYSADWSTWFKGTEMQMYETLIKLSTEHREGVLDPFMNTGDIGEAAINSDRHYTGIEPNGLFYRTAIDRLDYVGE